jgi:isoquinoline 1-oxidoreductase beta subunit
MQIENISRRDFFKASAFAVGGFALSFSFAAAPKRALAASGQSDYIATWLQIDPQGTVHLWIPASEMGQGSLPSLTQILADEMEADYGRVQARTALNHPAYHNPIFGMQATGGSTSVRAWWKPLREVGATVRAMMTEAGATMMRVPVSECRAYNHAIVHTSGASVSFAEAVEIAADLAVPSQVQVKARDEYRYIGKAMPRVDLPAKVNGSAEFGIDVQLDGMLVATVQQSPVFGGEVASMNQEAALAVRGVQHVVEIPNGVAVVANSYWQAQKGLKALNVRFRGGGSAGMDTAALEKALRDDLNNGKPAPAHVVGDVAAGRQQATQTLEMEYYAPYLAHATMEPMNATAWVTDEFVKVWAPTQAQTPTVMMASNLTGLPPEKIEVNTTFLGTGLGRRFEGDFVMQALMVSQKLGKPVKVVWSREEDMRHDFYRPQSLSRFRVDLGKDGLPVAWENRIACQSIFSRVFPGMVKNGVDHSSVEGAADDAGYAFANQHTEYVLHQSPIPVGFWRSVGHSQNAFFMESAIDEAAHAAGIDPVEYRLKLMKDERLKGVLRAVAEKANWGSPRRGVFQGVAAHASFGSYVAQVAEVSMSGDALKVERVFCVADCGTYVNPQIIEMQMMGGIMFGLTAAAFGSIGFANGAVVEGNFDRYQMVTQKQAPEVHVTVLDRFDQNPGGFGEPGVPPLAPAVTNAIFAATGKRLRSLPLQKHGIQLV